MMFTCIFTSFCCLACILNLYSKITRTFFFIIIIIILQVKINSENKSQRLLIEWNLGFNYSLLQNADFGLKQLHFCSNAIVLATYIDTYN